MSADDTDDEATTDDTWSAGNSIVIIVFFGLTVVGLAISTGSVRLGVVIDESMSGFLTTPSSPSAVAVPWYVYLYATLGALGYIFTKLMQQLSEYDSWSDIGDLIEMGLRIPAAWLLAAGVFLLARFIIGENTAANPRLLAGLAFLVGLYVNVAYKSLGGLADRLLNRQQST